jgi:NAD(P)-dependent dehydrogenase (short-subunit alcohol dehydrogenase family)
VFYGAPLVAHYVTSKAGVIGLTRSLARELGEYNITVNAIAPGLTMSMEDVSEAREAQNQQRFQARAIKRTEVPQDLGGTVVFLCSSDSDFMAGQTLVVDGSAQRHSARRITRAPSGGALMASRCGAHAQRNALACG